MDESKTITFEDKNYSIDLNVKKQIKSDLLNKINASSNLDSLNSKASWDEVLRNELYKMLESLQEAGLKFEISTLDGIKQFVIKDVQNICSNNYLWNTFEYRINKTSINKKVFSIICFYLYNKPWSKQLEKKLRIEIAKEETTQTATDNKTEDNGKEGISSISNGANPEEIPQNSETNSDKSIMIGKQEDERNNQSKVYNKKIQKLLVILGLIISCLIIIYLIFIINNLSKDNASLKNEYDKLSLIHNKSETEYQSIINNLYNPEYFNLHQFNEKGYDSLKIPARPLLFKANFNEIGNVFRKNSSYLVQGIELKPIFIKDSFDVQPGIKTCRILDGLAFGFGKSRCTGDCFLLGSTYDKQNYLCILRISFTKDTYISYITFKWVEVGGNWGSSGFIYINGNPKYIGKDPYQYIGIWPPSNKINDERYRNYRCKVDTYAKYIDIAVWDISYESEIFINNIYVWK